MESPKLLNGEGCTIIWCGELLYMADCEGEAEGNEDAKDERATCIVQRTENAVSRRGDAQRMARAREGCWDGNVDGEKGTSTDSAAESFARVAIRAGEVRGDGMGYGEW